MIGRTQLSEVEEPLESFEEMPSLERIIDERGIRRVVDEIDNLCDRKDWEKLSSLFTEEVDVDFTSLASGEPSKIKVDDFVGAWKKNLFAEKKTFHQRGNHRIKINGDKAEVFSKAYAFNLLEKGEITGLWEVWGNYTHTLTRTETGWKCSGMTLDVIHHRGDESVRTFIPGETEN